MAVQAKAVAAVIGLAFLLLGKRKDGGADASASPDANPAGPPPADAPPSPAGKVTGIEVTKDSTGATASWHEGDPIPADTSGLELGEAASVPTTDGGHATIARDAFGVVATPDTGNRTSAGPIVPATMTAPAPSANGRQVDNTAAYQAQQAEIATAVRRQAAKDADSAAHRWASYTNNATPNNAAKSSSIAGVSQGKIW